MDHPKAIIEGPWIETTVGSDPAMDSSGSSFSSIVLTMLFSILFITSSLLNTLFLIIFMRKPSLRNISNRFIVSLTLSNLVSSWVLLPVVVADIFLKNWSQSAEGNISTFLKVYPTSDALCTTFNIAADFTTSASVFSTVLIAFDRFFAITDPLHYHMLVTKCRSWIFIGLGWFLAILVAMFSGMIGDGEGKWHVCEVRPALLQEYYYWGHLTFALACFIVCFALPLLMLSWAYAKIYAAAQQNSERARRSSLCSPTLEVDTAKCVSRSSSTRSTSSQIVSTIRRRLSNASLFLYKEEARAAKISVGVIVLFLYCWFPYYLTKIIYATFGQNSVPLYVFKVVLIFTLTNSTISPYVYMYRSKRIQREVLRLFGVTKKAKRGEFERRRPTYHQLSANLEKIPASPVCLEGNFKLMEAHLHSQTDSSLCVPPEIHGRRGQFHQEVKEEFQNKNSKTPFYTKLLHPKSWKRLLLLRSSPSSASSTVSSNSTSSSSCQTSYISSNITASSQSLSNLLQVKTLEV